MNDRSVSGDQTVSREAWIDEVCDRYEAAWLAGGDPPSLAAFLRGEGIDPENVPADLGRELKRLNDAYRAGPAGDAPAASRSATDSATDSPTATPTERTKPKSTAGPGLPAVPGYELLGELGRGGMGVVFHARQIKLNRAVALKMVLGGKATRKELIRFLAEAEAVAAVKHPNVVQVHEYGEHQGHPYLAMEYLSGGTLSQQLKKDPAPPKEVAATLAAIADGVAAAHEAGVVHRDLKPGNVLFGADGAPKVTDFGLAKRRGGADLTLTGSVLGTPAYMAPEQADGKSKFATPAVDVWAMGVILYQALTGKRPFNCPTDTPKSQQALVLLDQVKNATPPAPRSVAPWVPRDLELICLKCLAKNPSDRYPTATELAADLRAYLAGRPISVRPVGAARRAAKWARRNPVVAGLLAAVVLVTAVGAGVGAWQYSRMVGERDRANSERRAAEAAADTAVAGLRQMTDGAVIAKFGGAAKLTDADRTYVRAVLKQWEALAAAVGDGEQSQVLRAEGAYRVAQLQYRLGEGADADVNVELAVDRYRALVADYPDRPAARRGLAYSLLLRASQQAMWKDSVAAPPAADLEAGVAREREYARRRDAIRLEAVTAWEQLRAADPTDDEALLYSIDARLMYNGEVSSREERRSRLAAVLAAISEYERTRGTDAASRSALADRRLEWATQLNTMSALSAGQDDADGLADRALADLEALTAASPGDHALARRHRDALGRLANALRHRDAKRAVELSARRLDAYEQLARRGMYTDDETPAHAAALRTHAGLVRNAGPPAAALPYLTRTIEQLDARGPSVRPDPDRVGQLLDTYRERAALFGELKRYPEQTADLAAAMQLASGKARTECRMALAYAHLKAGRTADALAAVEELLADRGERIPAAERWEYDLRRPERVRLACGVLLAAADLSTDDRAKDATVRRVYALLADLAKADPAGLARALEPHGGWGASWRDVPDPTDPFRAVRDQAKFKGLVASVDGAKPGPPPPPPEGMPSPPTGVPGGPRVLGPGRMRPDPAGRPDGLPLPLPPGLPLPPPPGSTGLPPPPPPPK